jgi:hypothetical protein
VEVVAVVVVWWWGCGCKGCPVPSLDPSSSPPDHGGRGIPIQAEDGGGGAHVGADPRLRRRGRGEQQRERPAWRSPSRAPRRRAPAQQAGEAACGHRARREQQRVEQPL